MCRNATHFRVGLFHPMTTLGENDTTACIESLFKSNCPNVQAYLIHNLSLRSMLNSNGKINMLRQLLNLLSPSQKGSCHPLVGSYISMYVFFLVE